MKRETRANLIFLGLFLAISLPGAVILFRKKLDPMASRMSLPDAARKRLAYMVPLNTPDEVTRFTPDLTAQWVSSTARERVGLLEVHAERWRPVVSDNRELQFIGLNQTRSTVYLMLWNDEVTPENAEEVKVVKTAEDGSSAETSGQTSLRWLSLPDRVRKELKQAGFIRPPVNVVWLSVELPRPVDPQRPLSLRVMYRTATGERVAHLKAFTHQS